MNSSTTKGEAFDLVRGVLVQGLGEDFLSFFFDVRTIEKVMLLFPHVVKPPKSRIFRAAAVEC